MVGVLMAIGAFSELPAMLYGAALARRWGGRRALLLAYATLGLSFVGFALAWTPLLLLFTGALRGLGFGLFFICTVQAIDERVPEEWSASAQAVMNAAAWGLAPLLAGPLSGVLFDTYGIRAIYVVCTIIVVISTEPCFRDVSGVRSRRAVPPSTTDPEPTRQQMVVHRHCQWFGERRANRYCVQRGTEAKNPARSHRAYVLDHDVKLCYYCDDENHQGARNDVDDPF